MPSSAALFLSPPGPETTGLDHHLQDQPLSFLDFHGPGPSGGLDAPGISNEFGDLYSSIATSSCSGLGRRQARSSKASATSFLALLFPGERSAGWDTGRLGQAALKGLVQIKTANDYLNLTKAQAAKMRQTNMVAHLRMTEASNVVKYLQDNSDYYSQDPMPYQKYPTKMPFATYEANQPRNPRALFGQLASGKGFGRVDPLRQDFGTPKQPYMVQEFPEQKPGQTVDPAASGSFLKLPRTHDIEAIKIKEGLEKVLEFTAATKNDAEMLQQYVVASQRETEKSLQFAAQELNYPGFPPELVHPQPRSKPTRPSALAPGFMDFLYTAASRGTDPYTGLENHNIFGSPPVPSLDVPVRMTGVDDKLENPTSVM